MEAVKYNFGETPEEVIREAIYEHGQSGFALKVGKYSGVDELLLTLAAWAFLADHGGTYEQHLRTPAWQLRVDALEELGIDES
jgi:hypothetical protein